MRTEIGSTFPEGNLVTRYQMPEKWRLPLNLVIPLLGVFPKEMDKDLRSKVFM